MPLDVYLNVAVGGVLTGLVYGLIALGAGLNIIAHRRRRGSDTARASLWPRFRVWAVAAALLMLASGLGTLSWAMLLAALALAAGRELSAAFRAAGWPAPLAAAYVAGPLALLTLLRDRPGGFELVVWTLLAVILTDVAAMFGGMFFGRRPLAPAISPSNITEKTSPGPNLNASFTRSGEKKIITRMPTDAAKNDASIVMPSAAPPRPCLVMG